MASYALISWKRNHAAAGIPPGVQRAGFGVLYTPIRITGQDQGGHESISSGSSKFTKSLFVTLEKSQGCLPSVDMAILKLKGMVVLCTRYRDVCPAMRTNASCLLCFQLDRVFRMNIAAMTTLFYFFAEYLKLTSCCSAGS